MAFVLFLLVNATLFLRPAEIIPELLGWNIYLCLILACLAAALPELVDYFLARPLDTQPVTLCVLGILVCVLLAPLAGLNLDEAFRAGFYFFKVVVYFVLLVSIVKSPQRLHLFVSWLMVFCLALTTVTLLQYHGFIDLQALRPLTDSQVDRVSGELSYFQRLQGSGVFHDPNELCVMLAAAAPLSLFLLTGKQNPLLRILWAIELALFLYAIALTRSRGGFLALLAGLGAVTYFRFGWRRTAAIGLLGLPLLFVLFDSRQTTISATEGTGRTRIQEWSDWLMEFRANPLVGNGMALPVDEEGARERLPGEEMKHLAHNSFLQGYADMGLVGGTLFFGAFLMAGWLLLRHARYAAKAADEEIHRMLPFLLGALAAYGVGLLTLSLCYIAPTYLMLGLAAAYANVAACRPRLPEFRLNVAVLARCAAAGVAYLAVLYVFVRVFISWA